MALQIWMPLTKDAHNLGLTASATTIVGATYSSSGGKLGGCYTFDGSDDRIAVNNSISLTYPISLAAWIYPTNVTKSTTLYAISYNKDSNGTNGHAIGIGMNMSNTLVVWAGGETYSTNQTLANNTWYHVVVTIDASKNVNCYVNGVNKLTTTCGTLPASKWLTIGSRSNSTSGGVGGGDYYFNGKVQDVRLYDNCLDDKSIKRISLGLVGGWLGNEGYTDPTTNQIDITKLYGLGSSWSATGEYYVNSPVYRNSITSPYDYLNAGFFYYLRGNPPDTTPAGRKVTLSFYARLLTPYSALLGGYFRFSTLSDSSGSSALWWSFSISNWATDSTKVGKWLYVTATVSIPSTATELTHLYVYGNGVTAGVCDYAAVLLEYKDHATPYQPYRTPRTDIVHDALSGLHNDLGVVAGTLSLSTDTKRYDRSVILPSGCRLMTSNTIDLSGEWTLSAWAKLPSITISVEYDIMDMYHSSSSSSIGSGRTLLFKLGGNTKWSIWVGDYGIKNSADDIVADKWYHLAATKDSSNKIRLYVNGVEQSASTTLTSYESGKTHCPALGSASSGSSYGQVMVSDARLYATCLSADDIKELASLGIPD